MSEHLGVGEPARAEVTLREREERRTFLLELSDALRPLADPVAVQGEACRLLAERLDVDHAYYVEMDETAGVVRIARDWFWNGASSLAGEYRISDFGWSVAILRRGECQVIADTQTSDLVPPEDRPASAALGIIACMGAPLIKEGRLVGALCVTQAHPRLWAQSDAELLREVGERVWAAALRARAEEELRESRERLRFALEAANIGTWDLDLKTGRATRSLTHDQCFGATEPFSEWSYERFLSFIHPDDRAEVERKYGEALKQVKEWHFECRVVWADRSVHWIEARGSIYRSVDGDPVRMLGIINDITERKRAEEALRALNATLERQVEDRTRRIEADARAQEAFVAFTEAVGAETDLLALSRQAIAVLSARFPGGSVGYYTRDGQLWKAQAWSEDMSGALLDSLRAGLPGSTPLIRRALEAGTAVFTDAWNPEREAFEHTQDYGTAAAYPLAVNGEVRHLLLFGLRDTRHWSESDRSLVRAVGRGLHLALERSEQARHLAEQNAELDARTRALEGVARLSNNLAFRSDPHDLIRQALAMVLSLLPPGVGLFYERRNGRWHAAVQVGDPGTPELQAAVDAGFPVGGTPTLDRPEQTREPFFQDTYDQALDVEPDLVGHLQTVATLPVMVNGEVLGIFNPVLFQGRRWSAADRALLETTVRSLGLTLEGAQGVAQLAQERHKLADANEELEAFTYSVSHDLRTPVRHVMGFNDLLRKQLGEEVDAKASRYLTVVEEAAGRMNTLIDSMLDLSRTSRLPLRFRPVDLGELVGAVRSELEADVHERAVEWNVAPLPLVSADPDTLRQVVTNLLDNALKYTRTREVTRIDVWAEERDREWAVLVRDNGVGFDPHYVSKLFGVFQRLHRVEDFEGTGVGLANVRRIIARHGGRVWAEGRPGKGATFGFTLPRR